MRLRRRQLYAITLSGMAVRYSCYALFAAMPRADGTRARRVLRCSSVIKGSGSALRVSIRRCVQRCGKGGKGEGKREGEGWCGVVVVW